MRSKPTLLPGRPRGAVRTRAKLQRRPPARRRRAVVDGADHVEPPAGTELAAGADRGGSRIDAPCQRRGGGACDRHGHLGAANRRGRKPYGGGRADARRGPGCCQRRKQQRARTQSHPAGAAPAAGDLGAPRPQIHSFVQGVVPHRPSLRRGCPLTLGQTSAALRSLAFPGPVQDVGSVCSGYASRPFNLRRRPPLPIAPVTKKAHCWEAGTRQPEVSPRRDGSAAADRDARFRRRVTSRLAASGRDTRRGAYASSVSGRRRLMRRRAGKSEEPGKEATMKARHLTYLALLALALLLTFGVGTAWADASSPVDPAVAAAMSQSNAPVAVMVFTDGNTAAVTALLPAAVAGHVPGTAGRLLGHSDRRSDHRPGELSRRHEHHAGQSRGRAGLARRHDLTTMDFTNLAINLDGRDARRAGRSDRRGRERRRAGQRRVRRGGPARRQRQLRGWSPSRTSSTTVPSPTTTPATAPSSRDSSPATVPPPCRPIRAARRPCSTAASPPRRASSPSRCSTRTATAASRT